MDSVNGMHGANGIHGANGGGWSGREAVAAEPSPVCLGCEGCRNPPAPAESEQVAIFDAARAAAWAAAWLRPCAASAGPTGVQLSELVAELDDLALHLDTRARVPLRPRPIGAPWPDRVAPEFGELRDVIDHLVAVWGDELAANEVHAGLVERLTRATRVLRRLLVAVADSTLLGEGVGPSATARRNELDGPDRSDGPMAATPRRVDPPRRTVSIVSPGDPPDPG